MSIALGNTAATLKLGSNDVQAAYLGSTLVYSPTTTTTSTTTSTTTTEAPLVVQYILVGGGGGGGRLGGGGGGGGIVSGSFSLQPGVTYSLTEGRGGYTAESGSATTAFGITALGGARGAGTNGDATSDLAYGGGGSGNANTSIQTGSIGVYGYNGGNGSNANDTNGGGAGGGGNGISGVAGQSGDGANPLSISYYFSNTEYFVSASQGGGGAATSTSARGVTADVNSYGWGGTSGNPGNNGLWPGGGSGGHSTNSATITRYGAMGYIQLEYNGPLNTDISITGSGAIHNYSSNVDKTFIRFVPPVDPVNGESYTWTIRYK